MGLYRLGFNGKENDNEVKGDGNQQDYGFRIYDPRVGRFLSVDPVAPKYPELTPYQFSSNRPIDGIDLDGLEFLGAGYLVDEISKGFAKLGFPRAAGFTETYGHGLLFDPVYSTHNFIKTAKTGDVVGTVQQVDPTGVTNLPNVYQTGKAALNGDPYAQGQVLGMVTLVYGAGKAARSAKGSSSTEAGIGGNGSNSRIGRNYENYGSEALDLDLSQLPLSGPSSEATGLVQYGLRLRGKLGPDPDFKFRSKFELGGYKYEVRSHGLDLEAAEKYPESNSGSGPTWRIERKVAISLAPKEQGSGGFQLGVSGKWYQSSYLKTGIDGAAVNDTHIPLWNLGSNK